MNTLLHPGFADPVRDAQATFRAVLDAMARPGRLHRFAAPADPPHPLDRATAAVLLTLVDVDTKLWLDDAAGAARGWVAFHCGAPEAALDQADFAVSLAGLDLASLYAGADETPESSATLVLQVAALGEGPAFRLTGPGLETASILQVVGLPEGFIAGWAANRRLFPRGIDAILCAGDRLVALPRTVTVEAL